MLELLWSWLGPKVRRVLCRLGRHQWREYRSWRVCGSCFLQHMRDDERSRWRSVGTMKGMKQLR